MKSYHNQAKQLEEEEKLRFDKKWMLEFDL